MNRRGCNEGFLAQQLSASPQDSGLEGRRLVVYGGGSRRKSKETRLRGLRKWHSVPSPSCCTSDVVDMISAKGPVSLNTTNEVGIMPIIGENEDFALTAISRWQSQPSLLVEPAEDSSASSSTGRTQDCCPIQQAMAKKSSRPKPPRRQKSVESIGEESE